MPVPSQRLRFGTSDWGPLVFVWSVWAFFACKLIDLVNTYGVDCPYYDEWEMIPALLGMQPITLKWLWSQHNEHRIFIPRLIYLAVEKLGGYDFRAGMYFNVLVLAASAAALIVAARRNRGFARYTDAFLPLVLMNLGQGETIINGFQIAFTSCTLLAVTVLFLSTLRRMGFRAAVVVGVCTAMLPLVGGSGMALVPALTLSQAVTGWNLRREPKGKAKMLVVWALGVLALALMAFYFVNYIPPVALPVSASVQGTLDAADQFLLVGLGSGVQMTWPQIKDSFLIVSGATAIALIGAAVKHPYRRARAIRLLLFLGAIVSLAIGIGRARVSVGPLFVSRYAVLAAPFWCALYLAWELADQDQLRRFAQTALLFGAATFIVPNQSDGVRVATGLRDVRKAVVDDARAGLSVKQLVDRYHGRIYYGYGDRGALMERIRALRARKIGAFAALKE